MQTLDYECRPGARCGANLAPTNHAEGVSWAAVRRDLWSGALDPALLEAQQPMERLQVSAQRIALNGALQRHPPQDLGSSASGGRSRSRPLGVLSGITLLMSTVPWPSARMH